MVDLSMSELRTHLDAMVRRAAAGRERVTITDDGGPAAVLLSADELADLEGALALAKYTASSAQGSSRLVPHDEAVRRLGLSPE